MSKEISKLNHFDFTELVKYSEKLVGDIVYDSIEHTLVKLKKLTEDLEKDQEGCKLIEKNKKEMSDLLYETPGLCSKTYEDEQKLEIFKKLADPKYTVSDIENALAFMFPEDF